MLKSYNGAFSANPKIGKFYRSFLTDVEKAERKIYRKLGIRPIPDSRVVEFELVDKGGIPMIEATGLAKTNGDVMQIELSARAVANNFWGLTSTQKVLTHEIVHIDMMYYGGENYQNKPRWMKEGVALWVAGQTFDNDYHKMPVEMRNGRWMSYVESITMFEEALKKNGIANIVQYLISPPDTVVLVQ